jgi:hypothetical protein
MVEKAEACGKAGRYEETQKDSSSRGSDVIMSLALMCQVVPEILRH